MTEEQLCNKTLIKHLRFSNIKEKRLKKIYCKKKTI